MPHPRICLLLAKSGHARQSGVMRCHDAKENPVAGGQAGSLGGIVGKTEGGGGLPTMQIVAETLLGRYDCASIHGAAKLARVTELARA